MKRLTKIILWIFIIADIMIVLLNRQNMSPAQQYFPAVHTAIFVELLFVLAQLGVYILFLSATVRAEKDLAIPALLFRAVSICFVIFYSISLFLAMSFKDTGMMKEF